MENNKFLAELEAILEKNPIIHTVTSDELSSSPKQVEQKYLKHAYTHMSLGVTKEYEDRIKRYIIRNNKSFIGAITGDYGLGKTSLLVYLWCRCEDNGILAVPPFSWRSIDDLFQGVESWINYRLSKRNISIVDQFKQISKKYSKRSLEKLIEELTDLGMNEIKARDHIETKLREGTIKLDRSMREFLSFCDDVTPLLIDCGFDGFMIFTDELQETIESLSPEKVFSYVFELADTIQDRSGRYGIMIGMPLNTKVQMQDVRSDVLDRLSNQKMFIDLSELYNVDFAQSLWEKYCEYFNFKDYSHLIIDEFVLLSLGQLTVSNRKDIGNGPRTVISAFKAIVENYKINKTQYTVFRLVSDILSRNIMMGENSKFLVVVSDLLSRFKNKKTAEKLISILSGFPNGCSDDVLQHYNINDSECTKLLTEWMGEYIIETPSEGFKIISLQPSGVAHNSYYERLIKDYIRYYEPSSNDARRTAVNAFNDILLKELFSENGTCEWVCLFEQKSNKQIEFYSHPGYDGVYCCDLGGAFERISSKYPNRHLQIVTLSNLSSKKVLPKNMTLDENYVFIGHWIFNLELEKLTINCTKKSESSSESTGYIFYLNLVNQIKETIPVVSNFAPAKVISPIFLLGLLERLCNSDQIPANEQGDVEYLVASIIDSLIVSLFSENMKKVINEEWECRNHGKYILHEIFLKMCTEKYPDYDTLMKGKRWKTKLKSIENILQSEKFSLQIKRGLEPIFENYENSNAREKREAAEIFGFASIQPLNSLIEEYSSLLRMDVSGSIYLRTHKAEQLCTKMIDEGNEFTHIDGNKCKAAFVNTVSMHLRKYGYAFEEIQEIFLLASLRKLFFYDQKQNKIYFKPLSIDEWKISLSQVIEKISDRKDILVFKGEHLNIPLENWKSEIQHIENEEQFEQLNRVISQSFNRINYQLSQFINKYIDILEDKLTKSARIVADIDMKLKSAENSNVKNSLWTSGVERLKVKLVTLQNEYQQIVTSKSQIAKAKPDNFVADSGIDEFESKYGLVADLSKLWDNSKVKRKDLEHEVDKFVEWSFYFKDRARLDNYFDKLEMLGLSNLRDSIMKLDLELEDQWGDIIPDSKEWRNKLSSIEKEINQKIQQSREQFEKEKEQLEVWTKKLLIKEKISQQFMEDKQSLSYELLYKEFRSLIDNQINSWLDETDKLIQKTMYLEQILNVDISEIESELKKVTNLLYKNKENWNKDQENSLNELQRVETTINYIKDKLLEKLQKGELDDKEEELYNLIDDSSLTLEEIILKYKEEKDSLNFDLILKLVMGLFKKNYIDIEVKTK